MQNNVKKAKQFYEKTGTFNLLRIVNELTDINKKRPISYLVNENSEIITNIEWELNYGNPEGLFENKRT